MTIGVVLTAIAGLGCWVLAAILRASGTALINVARADAIRAGEEGKTGADRVASLLDRYPNLNPSIGVVHSALLVLAAILGVMVLWEWIDSSGWSLWLALLVLGVMLIVFGDLWPRRIGRSHSRSTAFRWSWFLALVLKIGGRITEAVVVDEAEEEQEAKRTDDETDELALISSVFRFSDTIVREVMVPRTDMVTVDRNTTVLEVMRLVKEKGFSRFPVIGEDTDDVLGVVIIKDLLYPQLERLDTTTIDSRMRAIEFVPETKPVFDLLREMQKEQTHMAAVVDEYGGTAGLVTIEDLLEELVGEITDEFDQEEPLISSEQDGIWRVHGRSPLAELWKEIGKELPTEEYDTVAGLVLGLAGRVPHLGEKFPVDSFEIEVTRLQGQRVLEVRVIRLAESVSVD